jgi:hypothetical protein
MALEISAGHETKIAIHYYSPEGDVAKWPRQGSAKPPSPVRIRPSPPNPQLPDDEADSPSKLAISPFLLLNRFVVRGGGEMADAADLKFAGQ